MNGHSSGVILDLDDTLIDTRRGLLPAALARVAEAAGVPLEHLNPRGKRIEEVLAGIEELAPDRQAAAAAAWYEVDLPPIAPLPGARDLLAALKGRTWLALVTLGDPRLQNRKLEMAGLRRWIDELVIRPLEAPGSKRDDFLGILGRRGLAPARCAVVGDDPEDELLHAAELGCLPIRVPQTPLEKIPEILERAGLISGERPPGNRYSR